jgi:hypothetical protein
MLDRDSLTAVLLGDVRCEDPGILGGLLQFVAGLRRQVFARGRLGGNHGAADEGAGSATQVLHLRGQGVGHGCCPLD